ncbi:hypothetical protein CSW58_12670 [Caulobacter sp. B11]|uniref:hypothetical protein n=1 Tax=Caulobacter sp. B11 TaxID=2048899 RepID=UPI000C12D324|nr:hypothetical protein [Caulobacter sp. B11]PHY12427.1 hypothetical protein CSW58_12670 [Caulobacter sp. B11]
MKFAPLAAVIALALTTSACVIIDADDHPDVSINAGKSDLEPIHGAAFDKGDLVIRVSSNGCTNAADFAVESSRRDGAASFTFTRKRPDLCRALMAEGVDLRFPLDAYGVDHGDRVRVRNPLVRP